VTPNEIEQVAHGYRRLLTRSHSIARFDHALRAYFDLHPAPTITQPHQVRIKRATAPACTGFQQVRTMLCRLAFDGKYASNAAYEHDERQRCGKKPDLT
jgi:hypothetical protein